MLKEEGEHLGVTVEKMQPFAVESTVVDDNDDGRWHEEIVMADNEETAEEMYRQACDEFDFDIVGNLDVTQPDKEIAPAPE